MVLSFVIAAVITIGASVTAAWLDACLRDEMAFLPKVLQRKFNGGRDPSTLVHHRRWRIILDRLILSLADQQLVTGLALLAVGYIKQAGSLRGAHFSLIVYMCTLSPSSHLACIVTLRKYLAKHSLASHVRIVLVACFAIALMLSMVVSRSFGPWVIIRYMLSPLEDLWEGRIVGFLTPFPLIWIYSTAILQGWLQAERNSRRTKRVQKPRFEVRSETQKQFLRFQHLRSARVHLPFPLDQIPRNILVACARYLLFSSPCTIFVLQVMLATAATGITLAQKFSKQKVNDTFLCTLNSVDENSWGFGQIVPMLLLWLPFLSALEVYTGKLCEQLRDAKQTLTPA